MTKLLDNLTIKGRRPEIVPAASGGRFYIGAFGEYLWWSRGEWRPPGMATEVGAYYADHNAALAACYEHADLPPGWRIVQRNGRCDAELVPAWDDQFILGKRCNSAEAAYRAAWSAAAAQPAVDEANEYAEQVVADVKRRQALAEDARRRVMGAAQPAEQPTQECSGTPAESKDALPAADEAKHPACQHGYSHWGLCPMCNHAGMKCTPVVEPVELIPADQLQARGYELHPFFGYIKPMGGEHDAIIVVGNWPFNCFMVSIRVDGAHVGTNAKNFDDLDRLESLLKGAPVDYDDVQYVDEDDLHD